MQNYKNLIAYKKSFDLSMKVFSLSKKFPKEETHSLTDQIRRSSRSVCSSLAEAYAKQKYEAHFISKLTDASMENSETIVWLDFALSCNYINDVEHKELKNISLEISRLINFMISNPEKFIFNDSKKLNPKT